MPKFDYKSIIKDIPDFPKKGIIFKDITPILENPEAFKTLIDDFNVYINKLKPDIIVGIESRGFLFGAPLALLNNIPFVLARKPNKLPRETISVSYALEYGASKIEIHKDSIKPNARVVIIDDLLATGGTANAVQKLIKIEKAIPIANLFVIELSELNGKNKLDGETISLIKY